MTCYDVGAFVAFEEPNETWLRYHAVRLYQLGVDPMYFSGRLCMPDFGPLCQ